MRCLKSAMKWDEDVFGLELDLDGYMIVAVSDFNSGAMENKGLNIFNTKYVLARPDTATDIDYQNIDRVVAHEYFHNWTGDRVTCRDWFQLSLKEGLTVFRDQEYGADMYSRAVQRISRSARPARGAVSRGRGPDGAPGAPGRLHGDPQFLHHDGVRERRGSGAHAAHAARRAGVPRRHGPVFPPPRRPGGDHRRLRPGDGRTRAGSTSASSAAGTSRRARRWSRPRAATTRPRNATSSR